MNLELLGITTSSLRFAPKRDVKFALVATFIGELERAAYTWPVVA
jgi:hypothetical protein